LLWRLGRKAEAVVAFERAASLTDDSALRAYLLGRASQ
jgi:predicted RNA polymerase sigma factor